MWENEPDISTNLLNIVDLATPAHCRYSFDGKVNGAADDLRSRLPGTSTLHPRGNRNSRHLLSPLAGPFPAGEDVEDVLRSTIRRVYGIQADDAALRESSVISQTARPVSRSP